MLYMAKSLKKKKDIVIDQEEKLDPYKQSIGRLGTTYHLKQKTSNNTSNFKQDVLG